MTDHDHGQEGLDFIVCDCCGSHILLTEHAFEHFDHWPEAQGAFLGFTCDDDGCGADLTAWVANPDPIGEVA